MNMKKNIFYLLVAVMVVSCTSSKPTRHYPFNFTEKDTIIGLNNNVFTRASIVGATGANLIKSENEKAMIKKQNEFEKNIREIQDIDVTIGKDGKEIKVNIKNDILFSFDSFELKENPKKTLNELAFSFKEFDEKGALKVIGHTDNIGTKEYNISLSLRRAESVANYLKTVGIDSTLIECVGKGMSNPVSDNKTESGRAKNRRVEIFFYPSNN